jgi:transposase-like protein
MEEFCDLYSTEEACMNALFEIRWPNGFICSQCGHRHAYKINSRRLPLYECSACHHQSSLTTGTVMEKSKTKLRKWFLAIFLVSRTSHGTNAVELSSTLNVTYKTAWLILHKIRHAMSLADMNHLLSGMVLVNPGIYGSPYNPSVYRHSQEHPFLIGCTLNDQGEPIYIKMKHLSKKLKSWGAIFQPGANEFIKKHVDPPTIGVQCVTGRYSSKRCKNLVKSIVHVNKWLNHTFHGLGPKHLQAYFDEFCYRLNLISCHTPIFHHLTRLCSTSPAITYSAIIVN